MSIFGNKWACGDYTVEIAGIDPDKVRIFVHEKSSEYAVVAAHVAIHFNVDEDGVGVPGVVAGERCMHIGVMRAIVAAMPHIEAAVMRFNKEE